MPCPCFLSCSTEMYLPLLVILLEPMGISVTSTSFPTSFNTSLSFVFSLEKELCNKFVGLVA